MESADPIEDEAIIPKPKRLAGAVSLFGGIDPFAAKKNLKSPDKKQGNFCSIENVFKAVSDTVVDMFNAVYHNKLLIFIGPTFRRNDADSCLLMMRASITA